MKVVVHNFVLYGVHDYREYVSSRGTAIRALPENESDIPEYFRDEFSSMRDLATRCDTFDDDDFRELHTFLMTLPVVKTPVTADIVAIFRYQMTWYKRRYVDCGWNTEEEAN